MGKDISRKGNQKKAGLCILITDKTDFKLKMKKKKIQTPHYKINKSWGCGV